MVKRTIKEMRCKCKDVFSTFAGPTVLKKCKCIELGYKKKKRFKLNVGNIEALKTVKKRKK